MNRDQFLAFLVRSVRSGFITESQAADILRRFDAGEVMMEQPNDRERDVSLALLLLFVAAGLLTRDVLSADVRFRQVIINTVLESLSLVQREHLRESLLLRYVEEARRAAAALASVGNVAVWESEMRALIRLNLIEQAMIGSGRALTPIELQEIEQEVARQFAFLARFADEAQVRLIRGTPFSESYITNRSEMYAGAFRAAWFDGNESDTEIGWVVDYIDVDDGGTCGPCHAAAGTYLPNSGPVPGAVCLGGSRCRCTREVRFDPAAYAKLIGAIAA